MKALTIWQPWATLIMIGAKRFEFRGWDYRTRYSGLVGQQIVIHAGARAMKVAEIADIRERLETGETALDPALAMPLLDKIWTAHKMQGVVEMAAGLGTAVLGKPRPVGEIFTGPAYDSDRIDHSKWAWPLTNIQPFDEPQHCRGHQGFWNWS